MLWVSSEPLFMKKRCHCLWNTSDPARKAASEFLHSADSCTIVVLRDLLRDLTSWNQLWKFCFHTNVKHYPIFGKTSLHSKMLKVLLIPQDGGLGMALSCSWAWGCLHGSCGKQGVNLTAHHQRDETLRMPVTAMHLWAGCSQGALFPSTGKIHSEFLINASFLLAVFFWSCPRATMCCFAWEPYLDLCHSSQIPPLLEFFAELCYTTTSV